MAEDVYGSTSMIISRTGAEPDEFGFDEGDDDALEEFIERLQAQASSLVIEFCDVVFRLVENEEDVLEGNGRRSITTRQYPVQEIHEIAVGSRTLDADQYELVTQRGRPDRNSGRIERAGSRHRRRWEAGRDVYIKYDWGYPETPPVVDGVVEDMVVETLERAEADRKSEGVQNESMDGFSVTYDLAEIQDYLTLTEAARDRLRPLKRQGRA